MLRTKSNHHVRKTIRDLNQENPLRHHRAQLAKVYNGLAIDGPGFCYFRHVDDVIGRKLTYCDECKRLHEAEQFLGFHAFLVGIGHESEIAECDPARKTYKAIRDQLTRRYLDLAIAA